MLINKCLFDKNVDSKKAISYVKSKEECNEASDIIGLGFSDDTDDKVIAQFAQANGWTLVTKDEDYFELYKQFTRGHPGLIWIRTGNASVFEQNTGFDRVLNKMRQKRLTNLNDQLAEVTAVKIEKHPQ